MKLLLLASKTNRFPLLANVCANTALSRHLYSTLRDSQTPQIPQKPTTPADSSIASPPNTSIQTEPMELSDEEIRDFVPYVGKNSKYSRRVVSYYLKQRDGSKLLKRSNINYHNITTDLKFEKQQKNKLLKFDSLVTNEILKLLNDMIDVDYVNAEAKTHHSDSSDNSKSTTSVSVYSNMGLINSKDDFKYFDNYHYYKDIPKLPQYFTPDYLEKYIHFLTHCNIYHKNSSRSSGLVPKLLNELVNLKNPKTCHLISNINIINDLIFFYSKKNDLSSMLEAYSLINQLKLSPDIKTFNLLLNVINYYRKLPHNFENPSNLILKYLNLIKLNNLKPTLATINMVYKSLPDSTSKILLLEFLENKNIKLNKTFIRCIISDLCCKLDILKLIDFLNNDKTYNFKTIDLFSFNAILNKYLKTEVQNNKLGDIWKFYLSHIHNFKPHISHLNLFLNNLKEQPVLSLTVLNHFKNKFHVTPDIQSYYLLIRNTVKAGYSNNWRQVIRIIYQEAYDKTNGTILYHASYWLLRARSFSLTDENSSEFLRFKDPLTEEELKLKAKIIKNLVIDDKTNMLHQNWLRNPNRDYKQTALLIQSIRNSRNTVNDERLAKNFDQQNNKQLSIHSKRRFYLKLIKHQALMKVYRKRIQTLKLGPKESLYRELSQRSLK